jgi:hypothetical protein
MEPKAPIKGEKPSKVADKPNPGLIFLARLRGPGPFALKRIASALRAATGENQEGLLQRLRRGQLVASAYRPGHAGLVELPPALWQDTNPHSFNVRKKVEGVWKTYDYTVSAASVIKHVVVPGLQTLRVETFEQQLSELIGLLNTNRVRAGVVVVATDAKLFADDHLGPIVDHERRGRHRTSDVEHLLIEMFRRLHLVPSYQLPDQPWFIDSLTDWWNEDPDRPARKRGWVRPYAQLVWTAIKRAPTA